MKTIKDVDVKDKTVLVRVDYNVPLEGREIANDLRIRASLPTLKYLREQGAAKIILISHLGRPKGREKEFSLEKVAKRLDDLAGKVAFSSEVSGKAVEKLVENLPEGGILLLENLRFYPGEKENSREFIKSIIDAVKPDLYVQDGFAVVHRAHASTAAVSEFLPVYAGLLLEKEVVNLSRALDGPARPLLLILGGAKVEDKKPLIENFANLADYIVVGGRIAAEGFKVDGPLRVDADDKSAIGKTNAEDKVSVHRAKIYVAEDFDEDALGEKLDIGPLSTGKVASLITDAGTIIWNGLLGKAEDPAFSTASTIVAELMGEKVAAETIVCGGDTTGFVENLMLDHPSLQYSLVSTGGGAALEFLSGKALPGIEAIQK